jgi:hypothetical protein
MKKCISVLALATIVAGGVFSQETEGGSAGKKTGLFSIGVGAYITGDSGGGYIATYTEKQEVIKMPYFGVGGFLFLDATYAELSFGFFDGGGKRWRSASGTGTGTEMPNGTDIPIGDSSVIGLDIGLQGKYPVAFGGVSVFPIFGINYRVIVGVKKDGKEYDPAGDFSALWFKFGGGLDYALTNNVYLRADLLYGIRLATKFENDTVDSELNDPTAKAAETRVGHGLDVKIAVGYTF